MIENLTQLEERLSRPGPALIESVRQRRGDLVVIGAGGKIGPSVARMARRAFDEAGRRDQVLAVSRFGDEAVRTGLEAHGVRTVVADLLEPATVAALPDAAEVLFLAGTKFGTSEAPSATWASNVFLPGLVADRYRGRDTVVYSTGCVYPLTPICSGGATEQTAPAPVGEYALSTLGRERIFEAASERHGTRVCIQRLNYAVELRYGILVDLARKILSQEPIDLTMGHVNLIWQGDANDAALRGLELCARPPAILNVTGAVTWPVFELANRLAEHLGVEPRYAGEEAADSLLSNASRAHDHFGRPATSIADLLPVVARWVQQGGATHDRPTHYEVRDGHF